MSLDQGDQIGQTFGSISILVLGEFYENEINSQVFGRFFQRKNYIIEFGKVWFGLHVGRFFHKSFWSPCPKPIADFF
jgi:hypothetical protein